MLDRHSVRSYEDKALAPKAVQVLERMIGDINREHGLAITLVIDEPDAFGKSIMAHYGKFTNVKNYFVMAGPKGDDTERRLGYYGEMLVLKAQELGLNTCWVGLTFSKSKATGEVPDGNKVYSVIALGYGANQGVQHKSKRPDQIDPKVAEAPEWYRRGIDAALLAPTALNQQKFRFAWLGDNRVKASKGIGFFTKTDLGIAQYHFELGAQPEKVEWC